MLGIYQSIIRLSVWLVYNARITGDKAKRRYDMFKEDREINTEVEDAKTGGLVVGVNTLVMCKLGRMNKRLNSLGDKYEKVNPLAVLRRAEIQYRMVKLQRQITELDTRE